MINSRKKNLLLNIIFGYGAQVGIIVLSFIGRKIFLHFLSVEYLGINGLYSNVLTLLSLPELGLDTAVVYFLYKPVAENNKELIYSCLKYFKKLYMFLAGAVFAVGIALIPILRYIINSDINQMDLIVYYLLFLINSVITYFVAHKVALLSAYQEQRVQKITALSSNFILQILHIIVLIIWKNYYLYVITIIISTVANNIILSVLCNKLHPDENCDKIVKFDKRFIFEKIKATFIYKIGVVLISSTDNILISRMAGTFMVGLYSNYYTVIAGIQSFIGIITTSLISTIGNLSAKQEKQKLYDYFNFMLFFYHFIAALGLIGFSLLLNDFIAIWIGKEYLFDNYTVLVISINFYIINVVSPVWMYREANGLFEKVKYLMVFTALINIVLSIVLGIYWGVTGILLATTISRVLTSVWYEPNILFRNIFNKSVAKYWIRQGKYAALTLVSFVISLEITKYFPHTIIFFVVKVFIVIFVCICVFFVPSFNYNEVKMIKSILKR